MSEQQSAQIRTDSPVRYTVAWLIRLLLTLGVGFVLLQAALDLSEEPSGLTSQAIEAIPQTGVSHPVTAVLLYFRAYDTFLEVCVLILAVLGVLAVRRESSLSSARQMGDSRLYDDPVLIWLVKLLSPLLVLTGGYLLWIGSLAPGGAFQAGALLAAAGVTLRMSGHPSLAMFSGATLRVLLLLGFMVFLATAIGTMLFQANMLQMPERGAGLLILTIETALTISIAVTLTALFIGAKSVPRTSASEDGQS